MQGCEELFQKRRFLSFISNLMWIEQNKCGKTQYKCLCYKASRLFTPNSIQSKVLQAPIFGVTF